MTRRFEYGALAVATGLVTGLCAVALFNPLQKVTAAPKAALDLPLTKLEITASGPAMPVTQIFGKNQESTVLGLGGALSIRALNNRHTASTKHTSVGLSETFERLGYDLGSIKSGASDVPRLFVASLPQDLGHVREPAKRKALFVRTVLPLILQANEEILANRRRLIELRRRLSEDERLGPVDRPWLIVIAEQYRVKRGAITALLERVDIVPPSIALAQAAEESGWGTSRFVREGNAIFGEWTFTRSGSLMPARRDQDKAHRIKAFGSLLDSVRTYALNLNTHRAYRKFRTTRLGLRQQGAPMDGIKLIDGLRLYSERGKNYVKSLRSIIAVNEFRHLDDARLSDSALSGRPLI